MKKKIYGALVLGSLLLSGGMVSCSDYDDDINSLNERVDGIEKTLADLKAKIEAGAVITAIEEIEGGYVIKTSDGKEYPVKNGEKGDKGDAGTKITIDENGYWCADDEPIKDAEGQPIKAAGEKGDQGDPGTPGADGKDGIWYEPGTDGYWYKVTPQEEGEPKKEKTTIRWQGETGSLTIVYDTENGKLIISGAEGMAEGETMVINTTSDLKSLALIPKVIDSQTGMPVVSFYNIFAKDGKIAESTNAKAYYRLNPANADVNAWEWSMIDRTAEVRAAGDNVNDLLIISDKVAKDGELTVTLKSRKSLADLNQNEIAIFALSGDNESTGEQIVSDYGKVTSEDLKKFSIINEAFAGAAFQHEYPTTEPAKTATADGKLVYNESIDLNTLTWTWAKDLNPNVTLEGLNIDGLTYSFEKPKTYLGNDGVTNQQDFVNLDGSVVTVNEYGTAAIGRTPIFLAKALVNGKEVASGYIKLEVVESAPAEDKEDEILAVDCGVINYQTLRAGSVIKGLEWTVVNQFYAKYNLTVDKFRQNYNQPTAGNVVAENGVTLTNNWWNDNTGTTTDAATISMDPTQVTVIAKLGQKREATITFESKDKKVYPNVVVKFIYQISDDVTFPALNDDYQIGSNMIQVKGRMDNGAWRMISAIQEHFENYLTGYNVPNNHDTDLYATLPKINNIPQSGATITGTAATNQDIKLTQELTTEYRDYTVNLNMDLVNGETQHYTYIVRFASPYSVSINALTLKTLPAEPSKADLVKAVVVRGPMNEVVYENGNVTTAGDTYKFAQSGYSFVYDITGSNTDSWESFGGNLTLDSQNQIVWDNDGAVLQKDKVATSKVTLKVPNVVINKAEGVVTVLSSEHSMN